MDTFEKIKELIVSTLNCDEHKVTLEANLKEDLEADSLDAVELCMAIEEAFDISISDDDISTFVTTEDIVKYVDSKA